MVCTIMCKYSNVSISVGYLSYPSQACPSPWAFVDPKAVKLRTKISHHIRIQTLSSSVEKPGMEACTCNSSAEELETVKSLWLPDQLLLSHP